MGFMQTVKRDFTRHRHKAAVLGVLFAVMVFMSVRAAFQMQPQNAAAMGPATGQPEAVPTAVITDGADAEERIRRSKELWRRLREKRGVGVKEAFVFEANYYPPDPNRPIVAAAVPETIEPLPVRPKVDDTEAARRVVVQKVREQLAQMKVQSTIVHGGKRMAVVNGQVVTVGDFIRGFEITAIDEREVEFKKEGVTSAVKMPDEPRGQ